MNSITLQEGDNLSTLAKKHGVSVNDLVTSNKTNTKAIPDIKNPNLIIAGESLNIPTPSVLQTTTTQRATTQDRVGQLGNMTTNMAGGSTLPTPGNPGSGPSADGTGFGGGSVGAQPSIDTGTGEIKDAKGNVIGKTSESIEKGSEGAKDDPLSGVKGEVDKIRAAGEAQITNMKRTLEGLARSSDAKTQARVQMITEMYGQRIDALKETYKRAGAAKDTANFRNGVNRYTPEQGQGVLTDNEVQLQMKITDVLTKMNESIIKAEEAQSTNDVKLFNAEFDKIEKYQKDINSSIVNLMKEATSYQNALTKKMQEGNKEEGDKMKGSMDLSKRVAPAVAASLEGLSKKEQSAFIEKYAKENGLDPAILSGDVSAYTGAGKPVKKTDPKATKGKAGSPDNPYISGSFNYTDNDLGAVESAFSTGGKIGDVSYNKRSPEGYVDVNLYKKMAENWTKSGGLVKDFVSKFPATKYINPEDNATLPTYLQNTTKPK